MGPRTANGVTSINRGIVGSGLLYHDSSVYILCGGVLYFFVLYPIVNRFSIPGHFAIKSPL